MGITLRPVKQAAWREIAAELANHKIPSNVFVGWRAAVEFDLADDPWSKLNPARNRRERFHEYVSFQSFGGIDFRVAWELAIEQVEDEEIAEIMEITITPLRPNLLA